MRGRARYGEREARGGGACGESPGRAPGAICIELVLLSVTAGRHLPQPAGYARASPQSSASPALGSRRQPPARGLLKEPAALPSRAPAPAGAAWTPRCERALSAATPALRRLPGEPRHRPSARGCEAAPQGLGLPAVVTDLPSALQRVDTGVFRTSTSKQPTFIIFIQAFFQDKKYDFY